MKLAFCWALGRRKRIAAKPSKGSPIVDKALLRSAALYKVEDTIRGLDPDQRRAVRQNLSRPLADGLFARLSAQSKRVSRKPDLGEALADMLRRRGGFRPFRVDPALNRRNRARFASPIGTCKINGIEPCASLRDLFTILAKGHREKAIDALMPWIYLSPAKT